MTSAAIQQLDTIALLKGLQSGGDCRRRQAQFPTGGGQALILDDTDKQGHVCKFVHLSRLLFG